MQKRTHALELDWNLLPHFWNYDEISFEKDGPVIFELILFFCKNDITFSVNEWIGPGGGNNCITLFGTIEKFKLFCEKFDMDFEDFEEFVVEL